MQNCDEIHFSDTFQTANSSIANSGIQSGCNRYSQPRRELRKWNLHIFRSIGVLVHRVTFLLEGRQVENDGNW